MDMNESFAFRDVLIIYINQPELWFWTEATMGVMGWFQQKTKEHVPLNIEKKSLATDWIVYLTFMTFMIFFLVSLVSVAGFIVI